MLEAIGSGLYGLVAGFTNLHWSNPIMIVVGLRSPLPGNQERL